MRKYWLISIMFLLLSAGGDDSDSTYVAGDVYQFTVICTQYNPNNR